MPSVTTQNIGAASAQTVPTNTAGSVTPRAAQQPPTVQQIAQITAVAADKATISLRTKDQNRSSQVAKKAEGSFRSQEDPRREDAPGTVGRVSRRRDKGSLDVEA